MMKLPSPSREQPVPLFKCQVQETGSECWPSIQHGHRGVHRALAGDLPLLLGGAAVQRQLRPYATDEEWARGGKNLWGGEFLLLLLMLRSNIIVPI